VSHNVPEDGGPVKRRDPGFLDPHVSIPLIFEGDILTLEENKAAASIRVSIRALIGWALLLNLIMSPFTDLLQQAIYSFF
jgi:hypothetical protein